MKNIGKVVAVSAILGFLVLMVIPVNAFPARPAQLSGEAGERLTGLVDRLEEQGYDMSAVRAAIESGDNETARTLMQQFMEEHKDELPAPPDGVHAGNGERMRPGMALNAIRHHLDENKKVRMNVMVVLKSV